MNKWIIKTLLIIFLTFSFFQTYADTNEIKKVNADVTYDYSKQFSLPSDCLRLVTVEPTNGSTKYDIEEDKILFDGTSLEIIYVKDQTDYNKLSPLVNETISAYLAYDLAYIITNDNKDFERELNV